MKFYKIIFINTLMLGTLISISAYSWFTMWIGLELNLLSFIPLLVKKDSPQSSEASLKYFLIQALSSMIILFSIFLILMKKEFFSIFFESSIYIFQSALLTKMGAAPFHFWFPEIMEGISWFNSIILLTWQKIAPMILLMYSFSMNLFVMLVILISMIISGLKSLNQMNLKKILTFSSINHIGWMLSILSLNQSIWLFYFLVYSFITISMILMFKKFNIYTIQQMFNLNNMNKNSKLTFFLNLLSLGGLPPFLGFLPKWMIIENLMKNEYNFLILMMIFSTLIMLYIYIRMFFQASTLSFTENKSWNFKSNSYMLFFLNFLNLMSLIIFTLLYNFY